MWGEVKEFFGKAFFWIFNIGLLTLLHVVDGQVFDVPEAINRFLEPLPRIWYPLLYGTLGLYIVNPFQMKIVNPIKTGRLFICLFLLLLLAVLFVDIPSIGGLNIRYVAVFVLMMLGGFVLACAARILEASEEQMRKSPIISDNGENDD